jgi:hypothetical protein
LISNNPQEESVVQGPWLQPSALDQGPMPPINQWAGELFAHSKSMALPAIYPLRSRQP